MSDRRTPTPEPASPRPLSRSSRMAIDHLVETSLAGLQILEEHRASAQSRAIAAKRFELALAAAQLVTVRALVGDVADAIYRSVVGMAPGDPYREQILDDLCRAGFFQRLDPAAAQQRIAEHGMGGLRQVDGQTHDCRLHG